MLGMVCRAFAAAPPATQATAAAAATQPGDRGPFVLRLSRPCGVGQSFHLDATTVQSLHWIGRNSDGDVVQQGQRMSGAELSGQVRVLAVADGSPLAESITIQSLYGYDGKNDRQLLPAGAVVMARATARATRFVVNRQPPTLAVGRALALLVHLDGNGTDAHYLDQAYGSVEPRRVGDSWSINTRAVADRLQRHAYPVPADALHGTVVLSSVDSSGSLPWLVLNIDWHSDGRDLPVPAAPTTQESADAPRPQLIDHRAQLEYHITLQMPADPQLFAQKQSSSSAIRLTGHTRTPAGLVYYQQVDRTEQVVEIRP